MQRLLLPFVLAIGVVRIPAISGKITSRMVGTEANVISPGEWCHPNAIGEDDTSSKPPASWCYYRNKEFLTVGKGAPTGGHAHPAHPPDESSDLTPRIINGQDALPNQFPWMVALLYRGEFICSSFLISPTIVMTAAHCVVLDDGVEPASSFSAVLGSIHRLTPDDPLTFSSVVAHSRYGETTEYDIAFLRLKAPVTLSDAIKPVCLPAPGRRFEEMPATSMGWGLTEDGTGANEVLKKASMPIPAHWKCKVLYSVLLADVTDNHTCAGGQDSGVCFGDSGGPLIVEDKGPDGDTAPLAVGVASFISYLGCKTTRVPGVYTSTSSYIGWLTEQLEGDTAGICIR